MTTLIYNVKPRILPHLNIRMCLQNIYRPHNLNSDKVNKTTLNNFRHFFLNHLFRKLFVYAYLLWKSFLLAVLKFHSWCVRVLIFVTDMRVYQLYVFNKLGGTWETTFTGLSLELSTFVTEPCKMLTIFFNLCAVCRFHTKAFLIWNAVIKVAKITKKAI